ncbi:hypothetical protein, partial [Stenotrophomonas sp. 3diitr2024]|uniref:hypothetical protein n=1 Tax=Stenotrophomonas sp. 3diitr2024 TaxID=3345115 RepID=UPI0035CB80C3
PELAYVQPDHLGTPRVVIDPVRNVSIWEWSNKSEVFGNQTELALSRIRVVVPSALYALIAHDGTEWDAPLFQQYLFVTFRFLSLSLHKQLHGHLYLFPVLAQRLNPI